MIRRATTDDASGIAKIHVETWRSAYSGIVSQSYLDSLSIEMRTETWIRQIDDPSNHIWVSFMDGSVSGFIAGGASRDEDLPDWDEIYAIYVSPEVQGRGIGRTLTGAFLAEHSNPCALWVLEENLAGIDFYRSIGFERDGMTKNIEIGGNSLREARFTNYANKGRQTTASPSPAT